jgi:hypothetical protein
MVVVSSLIYGLLCILLWNSSKDPREDKERRISTIKNIVFMNNSPKSIKIYIDGIYIDSTSKQKIIIKDSVLLGNESNNNINKINLPISIYDSINFFQILNIKVEDSLKKIIYTYNREQFLYSCQTDPSNIKSTNKISAISWILKIE